MRRHRPNMADLVDATEVHLYRSHSVAPLLALKKKLRCVACLVVGINRDGFFLARGLELDRQCACVICQGPVGLDWASSVDGPGAGLTEFGSRVDAAIDSITDFVKRVIIHRREFAVRG